MALAQIRYKQPASDKAFPSNGTTAATVYTFATGLLNPDGAAGFGGVIDAIDVYNSDTVQHDVVLHLIASGGSLGNDTVIERITVPAGQKAPRFIGPYRCKDSAILQVKLGEAHTSTPVYVKAEVSEFH